MTKAVADSKAHAEYSASGSQRWRSCPGSHELGKKAVALYGEPPESEYAAEGTEAHACLEFLLKNSDKHLGKVVVMARKTYSDEMVQHAFDAATWILGEQQRLKGSTLLCETKVDTSDFLCSGQFGTVDSGLVQEFGTLHVIDYKYGAGIAVDPEGEDGNGNSQLVCYALGLSYKYHHNFTRVLLTVIQPRAYHESGETTRTHEMTVDELLAWKPIFREAVMETNNPKAKLVAGSHCKYCPAARICPEIGEKALERAKVVFAPAVNAAPQVPDPKKIPIEKLPEILNACEALDTYIDAVRAHAYSVLNHGGKIEGYKLVQKRANRRWKNEGKTTAEARKRFGDKAFTAPELLSPAKLEKLSAAKDWVASRTTAESSGTTLVRDDDKRQGVKTLKETFGALPTAAKKREGKK